MPEQLDHVAAAAVKHRPVFAESIVHTHPFLLLLENRYQKFILTAKTNVGLSTSGLNT